MSHNLFYNGLNFALFALPAMFASGVIGRKTFFVMYCAYVFACFSAMVFDNAIVVVAVGIVFGSAAWFVAVSRGRIKKFVKGWNFGAEK